MSVEAATRLGPTDCSALSFLSAFIGGQICFSSGRTRKNQNPILRFSRLSAFMSHTRHEPAARCGMRNKV